MKTTPTMREAMRQKAHKASLDHDPDKSRLGDIALMLLDDVSELVHRLRNETVGEPDAA